MFELDSDVVDEFVDVIDEGFVRGGVVGDGHVAVDEGGPCFVGAVGGAAVGVGAMELFGNSLIKGAVEGQKDLEGLELLESQLAVLRKDNETEYNRFIKYLGDLKCACDVWPDASKKPAACTEYEYAFVLPGVNNKMCAK